MNDNDKQRALALVNKLLNEAQTRAAAGNYKEALTAVKKAKALDQANIFLLALERQIEQIHELALTGILTDAQKTDILDSIPKLVDQATRVVSGDERATASSPRKETPEEHEAKLAAGRWLKNQYFQRSHEFVRKAEYEQALAELRKIFSIDDQDKVAREFELKILQMLEISRHQPTIVRPEVIEPVVPVKPVASPEVGQPPVQPDQQPRLRKKRGGLWVAIIVATIVVALATLYFIRRQNARTAGQGVQNQEKTEEVPLYPVPPAQIPQDTTRHDTVVVR
jgi:tetratricopeptide (TPR) repeat protein